MTAPLDAVGFAAQMAVSRETLPRFEAYAALLRRWSSRVNLVGRNTLGDLWRRHFLDSAQIRLYIPAGVQSVLDIGSGAGFPGLVLALLGVPGIELVESDGRKCAFLQEAIRITAAPATLRHARAETVPARSYDVVTARACAPLDGLLTLAERFIGRDTRCIFLKGERADAEIAEAARGWTMSVGLHRSLADPRGAVVCLDGVGRARA